MRIFPIFCLILLVNFSGFAQQQEEEDEGIDTKTLAFGATTSNYTNLLGGVIARSSIPVSIRNNKTVSQYIAIEILNLKNPREYSQFYGFGPKYTLGKRNYLFSVRPQYGREFSLFERTKDSNLGMSLILAGGPSIGVLKPYYVKYEDSNIFVQYDPNITGRISNVGGILKNGLKGSKVLPGIHLKAAANIDINTFGDNVTGLEIGTTLETFFKEVELIAEQYSDNPKIFGSVYLTIYIGNKKIIQSKKSKEESKAKSKTKTSKKGGID